MATIRPATLDDAEAIGVLHMKAWREAYGHLLSDAFFEAHTAQASAIRWRRTIAREGPAIILVATDESAEPDAPDAAGLAGPAVAPSVLGFATSGPPFAANPPRELELFAIYTLATHYGSGIGQSLLDAAIGDKPASLWVAEDNPRATAFYRRNGFEFDGTRDVVPSMENLVELRMVR